MPRRPWDGRGSPNTMLGNDALKEYEERLAAEDAKVESLGEMVKRRQRQRSSAFNDRISKKERI